MAVESVHVFDRHGKPVPLEGDAASFAGGSSVAPFRTAPAKHSGGFVIFIDPDVFESDAEAVAQWLTRAGLGHFAVGSGETAWPADLSPDHIHLRSMLRRVRLLQAACRGRLGARDAVAEMIERSPTEPPPPSARAAKAARKAQTQPKPKKGPRS
jgi:hypothetical protein